MRTLPLLNATAPGVVIGRHAIWFPDVDDSAYGLKVPFQWGGRVTKYGHKEASYPPEESLPHELRILRALADLGMAPPVGDLVYIETLISNHPGGWHADPCGVWAYEMADASELPPGRFDLEAMKALPIVGSEGAWGDVCKPGNVVNGYLVDVRRSGFDLLRWSRGDIEPLPLSPADDLLVTDVHRLGQFPPLERTHAYQDFYTGPRWQTGERRVIERAIALGFMPRPGDTVLEIGCQTGGFLAHAYLEMRGEGVVLGAEVNRDYIDLARRLARRTRQNIAIRQIDAVAQRAELLAWVAERCPGGLDHLLVLSMEKHLGEAEMFSLIDAIGARRTYIETNAVSEARPWKLLQEVADRGGIHVGNSNDRNLRRLYRIERP